MQLPTTVTLAGAGVALDGLRAFAAQGGSGTWEVDASTLQVFDTAALAVLLQARRQAQAAGRAWRVHGGPPKLTELAQLYGVAELLGLVESGPGLAPIAHHTS